VADQLRQQRRREVVDAEEAAVLEHVERNALARAGHSTDQYETHRATSNFIHGLHHQEK
jgi:hypothetical protein